MYNTVLNPKTFMKKMVIKRFGKTSLNVLTRISNLWLHSIYV